MAFTTMLENKQRSVPEAVEEFKNAVNPGLKSGDETSLEGAWRDLTTLVQQTDLPRQERLVHFVNEIRKQPGPLKADGKKVEIWGQETSWESLPLLGPQLRECWNAAPKDSEDLDQGWVNLNAFVARLTALSSKDDGRDFSLYGIWALRDALEEVDHKKNLPNKSSLQAAAMWMIYAAPRLREQAEENRSFEGKIAKEGKTLSGKDWTGFSMERWNLWNERLQEARDLNKDETTKDLLQKAISSM